MNVFFVVFIVCVTSTVNADPCDQLPENLFKILDQLIHLFTKNKIAAEVFGLALKPFFYGRISEGTVKYLILPTELNVCKNLARSVVNTPIHLKESSLKGKINVVHYELARHVGDLFDVCDILPVEGEKYLEKVKNLINSTSETKIATLDSFCKENVTICNVTDSANVKLIAYLSHGYSTTFQPFVEMIRSDKSFDEFRAIRHKNSPWTYTDGYYYCILRLTNFTVNKILNTTLTV